MKQMKRLLLMLCLFMAGVQSTWAQSEYYVKSGSTTEGNLSFDLYNYYYSPEGIIHYPSGTYAALTGISGTEENVVVPDTLNNGAIVQYLDGTISNNYVRTLTFEGTLYYYGDLLSFTSFYPSLSVSGTLDCPYLKKIIFEGDYNQLGAISTTPCLLCPNLTDIYFKGSKDPSFARGENVDENGQVYYITPHWSNICTAPAENVTAHIAAWHLYSYNSSKYVFRELKACVPYSDTYNVTLKSNSGGEIKVYKVREGNSAHLQYTMSSEGGQETITLDDNAVFYRICMYYSGNGQPTLLRNGIAVGTTLSSDGSYYYYDDYQQMLTQSYEVVYPSINVNLVVTAEACDKGIEVWNGNTQVGSISKDGGTFYETINNATNATSLQLRVPNQYLEKITVNGTDVTASLPSTTPSDLNYAGYTFYTLADLAEFMVVEVQYNDNVPVPFATSSIEFVYRNGTGQTKNWKIWFEDGTSYSNVNGWEGKRTISRIEITMKPDLDNFDYAQQYNTLGTIVNNGDGTYTYTIPGENLTSSIIPLYFPTSNFGPIKTLIRSKNNFKLGYYFGEWINMEGGFVPEYDQANTSLLNSDVTVMHFDTHNYQAEGGGYSTGIVFVQVTQGTTFRLVEDGVDRTGDCVWCNANQTFTASPLPFSYTCPVAGFYYLLKNVTTDSYIIVDNGSGAIVSPWQVLQTASVIGEGTLSLLNSEGTVVGSVGSDGTETISWTKGDYLKLRAMAPGGSDLTNVQAHLFLDDAHCLMTKTTNGGNTYFEYIINEVTSAHSFTLVFSGLDTSEIIEFADANVKAICVANWDTDHDGELSKKEAAAVTTLVKNGTSVFYNKKAEITSFNEFQYFTGLTTVEIDAFHDDSIHSIILPPTITSIEKNAFMKTRLQYIDIPEGVTSIGGWVFYECGNLGSIRLPKSLETIGANAFSYTGIRHIFIPENVTSIPVLNSLFMGSYKLSSIVVDEKNTGYNSRDNCSAILRGNAIYSGCKNTVIPEGVNTIQKNALRGVGLKHLVIPASVIYINENALAENALDTLVMKRTEPILFNANMFTADSIANCVLVVPRGKITAYANAGWKSITNGGYFKEVVEEVKEVEIVTLPDNIQFADTKVKTICVNAGWDTDGDGEISKTEAAAVTSLLKNGSSVFAFQQNLTSFDEFQYFTGLTTVERSAFYCSSFQSIILPPTITSIERTAFTNTQIRSIDLPEGVTAINDMAFSECGNLEEVKLPKSLTSIGAHVFEKSAIRHIFIPENVNSITPGSGGNIFHECPNLSSISVDEHNTKYDSRDNCSAIIEKSSSGDMFLYGCKNSFIPDGVKTLWAQALSNSGLTKIVVPASVQTIYTQAFTENTLDTLQMKRETPITFNAGWFTTDKITNCVLVVPYGKVSAYANAGWKSIADGGYFKEVVEDKTKYDVNSDGTVSIADVTKLVNVILGK